MDKDGAAAPVTRHTSSHHRKKHKSKSRDTRGTKGTAASPSPLNVPSPSTHGSRLIHKLQSSQGEQFVGSFRPIGPRSGIKSTFLTTEERTNEGEIPTEVLFLVFSILEPQDMKVMSLVSHVWHKVSMDDAIWSIWWPKDVSIRPNRNLRGFYVRLRQVAASKEAHPKEWSGASALFNNGEHSRAFDLLVKHKVLSAAPHSLVHILFHDDVDAVSVGDFLGNEANVEVFDEFLHAIDFVGAPVDLALRMLVEHMVFPSDHTKFAFLLRRFAMSYFVQNANSVFANADAVYTAAVMTVMLNTSINANAGNEQESIMSNAEFVEMGKGANSGGDFPPGFLDEMYKRVIQASYVEDGVIGSDEDNNGHVKKMNRTLSFSSDEAPDLPQHVGVSPRKSPRASPSLEPRAMRLLKERQGALGTTLAAKSSTGGGSVANNNNNLLGLLNEEEEVSMLEALSDESYDEWVRTHGSKRKHKTRSISEDSFRRAVPYVSDVSKKGWLHKLSSGMMKRWDLRWFVLRSNCLYYYKDPDALDALGMIPLSNVSVSVVQVKSRFCIKLTPHDKAGLQTAKLKGTTAKQTTKDYYLLSGRKGDETECKEWSEELRAQNSEPKPLLASLVSMNRKSSVGKGKNQKKKSGSSVDEEVVRTHPMWGVSLMELAEREHSLVPELVIRSIDYLTRTALDEEGLLRLSGARTTMNALRAKFEGGAPVRFEGEDPHTVTGMLKSFFREMPEPLIASHQNRLAAAIVQRDLNEMQTAMELKNIVVQLPEANYQTMKALVRFLVDVANNSRKNRMTKDNVLTVMVPTLQCVPALFSNAMDCFEMFFDDEVNGRKEFLASERNKKDGGSRSASSPVLVSSQSDRSNTERSNTGGNAALRASYTPGSPMLTNEKRSKRAKRASITVAAASNSNSNSGGANVRKSAAERTQSTKILRSSSNRNDAVTTTVTE